jgi:hypothetical protein
MTPHKTMYKQIVLEKLKKIKSCDISKIRKIVTINQRYYYGMIF